MLYKLKIMHRKVLITVMHVPKFKNNVVEIRKVIN